MIQNSIFVVNDEPYCLWEVDIRDRNIEFLNGLDPDYFQYLVSIHINADDEKRASIALRVTFHHAIETLFSLIGAYVQAPDCAYAWIGKCSNLELRKFVQRIRNMEPGIFTKLTIASVTWENIAQSVFHTYQPGSQRQADTVKCFSRLWLRLATEFTDPVQINEYNSLKHGFRVRSGGFALVAGVEHEYGVPPPADDMRLVGKSDYGMSFFKLETLGKDKGNRSLRSRRTSVNWSIERVVLLLQLCYFSIQNVIAALRFANGIAAENCKFLRPESGDDFDRPWQYSPGVTSLNIDHVINDHDTISLTRQELLDKISGDKDR